MRPVKRNPSASAFGATALRHLLHLSGRRWWFVTLQAWIPLAPQECQHQLVELIAAAVQPLGSERLLTGLQHLDHQPVAAERLPAARCWRQAQGLLELIQNACRQASIPGGFSSRRMCSARYSSSRA